ncbi:MAG: TlpA family protein disulfide reductase [Burkholderiaceae bacterium]|jgi:peroxiredoxin|nr:TlpA family protein disulfide reductase [Burkholderiaceae bacterium]
MKIRVFLIALLLSPIWVFAQVSVPDSAPATLFSAPLVDFSGQPTTLASLRGQPLIVNFWARWCGPCRVEIPDLVAEQARMKSAGVQVVGVALDDKPDAVRDFAKAYDIDYQVLLLKDNGPDLLKQLGNPQAGLPYTLVIDRSGKVVSHKLGAMSRAEMASAMEAASK